MSKRQYNYDMEYDRFQQNLEQQYGKIKSKDMYDKAYNDYMKEQPTTESFKQDAWQYIKDKNRLTIERTGAEIKKGEKPTYPKGEGRQEYGPAARTGAEITAKEKRFNIVASKKGRVVYARQITTKAGQRLIDRKGQYCSKVVK